MTLEAPKKKIALLHYNCPPMIGGVENVIQEQCKLLLNNNYDIKVLAGRGDSFLPKVDVRINPDIALQTSVKDFDKLKSRIKKWLGKELEGVHACIAHNVFSMPFNLPLTEALHELAGKIPTKFIAYTHDLALIDESYKIEKGTRTYELLSRYNKSVTYTTISLFRKRALAQLQGIDENEILVINNGVNLPEFMNFHEGTINLINKYDLRNCFVVLCPVRVMPRKNLKLAVRITAEISKTSKAKLLITGPTDPYREEARKYLEDLKQLISELGLEGNVIFLYEEIDMSMLRDLYIISDILLLTSESEGFGLPVLEAGICKLPVFITDIDVFKELFGYGAYYFNLKDEPSDIAEMILSVTNNARQISLFKRVLRKYDWQMVYEGRLKKLLS